jgi:3'(2'), 5'-bisphosphate nucleotidase
MLDEIVRIAESAGHEILKIYRSNDWQVSAKSDDSPVTRADLAANEIIVRELHRLSSDPVISEEDSPLGSDVVLEAGESLQDQAGPSLNGERGTVKKGRRFWLVDPLDGTRDFLARLDTFVVSIALVQDGFPVLGVLHAPVTGETWRAEVGRGAHGPLGQRLQIRSEVDRPLVAVASRSMASERMHLLYQQFGIGEVQRVGSALKFCRLAEGKVDVYPRFGPMREWDTAAGQILVEEAGGKVIELASGKRLEYGKPGFEHRGGFVASRSDLDIVKRLREIGVIQ